MKWEAVIGLWLGIWCTGFGLALLYESIVLDHLADRAETSAQELAFYMNSVGAAGLGMIFLMISAVCWVMLYVHTD